MMLPTLPTLPVGAISDGSDHEIGAETASPPIERLIHHIAALAFVV
jgi:hypothetical protein